MPIYSYECKHCMQDFEAIKRISDSKKAKCPYCGSIKTYRTITAPNIICNRKSSTQNELVSEKLKPTGSFQGSPYYANPSAGLNAITYVGGLGYVEHPNLAGSPPGCDSRDGRIVVTKNKKTE